MEKTILILILFFCMFSSYAEAIHDYDFDVIRNIDLPELGYAGKKIKPHGPQAFTVSPDNFIYILDTLQRRIVVYDLKLNFLQEIPENNLITDYFWSATQIKVSHKESAF